MMIINKSTGIFTCLLQCRISALVLFKQLCVIPKPFVGVKKLITNTLSGCSKAVVSGSAKEEVNKIIEEIFGIDVFDVIINGDQFEGIGKPDPASFEVALERLNVKHPDAVVVENAPLGVKAVNSAWYSMYCYIE